MYEVETIEIDEDNRLVVYYDEDSEDPREWVCDVNVNEMNYQYGYEVRNDEYDPAVSMFNEIYDRTADTDKALRAMQLWMKLEEDERAAKLVDVRVGRDVYNYLVTGETTEQIDGFMEDFSTWMNGEVYIVVHQKREQWTNADETAEMDTWEPVDSLGGCYLDDNYTALDVARDYFDVELDK